MLSSQDKEPLLVQRVSSPDMMMALISAGLALGFAGAVHIAANSESNIVARPLAGKPPMLATFLRRRDTAPSQGASTLH